MDANGSNLSPHSSLGNMSSLAKPKGITKSMPENPKLRKRTKTGCLTCRKRRIKCGEERPICNNCIKSKRHCEGYNQRVIFKPPIDNWPNAAGAASTIPFHNGMLPGSQAVQYRQPQGLQPGGIPLTPIQPRMPNDYGYSAPVDHLPSQIDTFVAQTFHGDAIHSAPPGYQHQGFQHQQPHSGQPSIAYPASATQPTFNFPPSADQPIDVYGQYYPARTQAPSPAPSPNFSYAPQSQNRPPPYAGQYAQGTQGYPQAQISGSYQQPQSLPQYVGHFLPDSQAATAAFQHVPPQQDVWTQQTQRSGASVPPAPNPSAGTEPMTFAQDPYHHPQTSQHQQQPHVADEAKLRRPQDPFVHPSSSLPDPSLPSVQHNVEAKLLTSGFATDHVSPTAILDAAAVEREDDDYYDVDSDEEMELGQSGGEVQHQGLVRDFSLIMNLHRQSSNEMGVRRYDTFIHDGILTSYHAEWHASPLKNPNTARVFAHFIHATGPSLSVHERHIRNASAIFSEGPVPLSQQGLWTYTLPMMALNCQGLLHAMLALSSLHIAKLQNASETPSYKHYAYALKRVHNYVGNPQRRHLVTTLAASLLLGFYEVMTADHLKWTSHLIGARQLFLEIDFVGMTKRKRREKAQREAYEQSFAYRNPEMPINQREMMTSMKHEIPGADERVVSAICGKKVDYEQFGGIIDEGEQPLGPGQIEYYDIYQDLYWWYARQDAYQSIISGNGLLMDYNKWTDCPPRAQLGRPDAIYSGHDHIILLLGRIADFQFRDRPRKMKAVEAFGGQWRPDANFPRGPQGQGQGAPPTPSSVGAGGQPGFGYPQNVQVPPTPTSMGSTPITPMSAPPGWTPQVPGMPGTPQSGFTPQTPVHNSSPNFQQFPQQQQMPPQYPTPQPQMQRPPGPPPQAPSFYGMAPTASGPRYAPSAFSATPQQTTPSPKTQSSEMYDLPGRTAQAMKDWQALAGSLNTLSSHLGPSYQPLSPQYHPPTPSPFGPARHYRSYDIGVVWALYYMCQIILMRCHPSMPPAAMMAAGVAAPLTKQYAEEIGRIAAGIVPNAAPDYYTGLTGPPEPLNPSLGATLIESTMPCFFAGIQLQDHKQRVWSVNRMLDIERRTGWASAGLIARGCETSWEKAYQAGRGPPYAPQRDQTSLDGRISGIITKIEEGDDDDSGREGYRISPGADGVRARAGDQSDRRFVVTNPATRVHWAIGLLGMEKDLTTT